MKLRYQVLGNRSSPGLVLLHGFLGSGDDWVGIANELAGEYCCVLPDLPGHGRSTNLPPERPLDFNLTSRAIVEMLDKSGLARVALVGYSMGGRVALHTSVSYPERINCLAIESASPGIEDDTERSQRARIDDQRANRLVAQGLTPFVDEWYDMPLFASLHRDPEGLRLLKQSRLNQDPQALAAALKSLSIGRQASLWNKLEALDIPTLVIAGQLDAKYCDIAVRISQRLPRARAATVQGAGHNAHFERPQEFLALLRDFLHDNTTSH
jgi:2-succinyl-6-hydroxy-2,4-cyclohexadiene-1-carboxylate synthase